MADEETEIPLASVNDIAEARNTLYRCAAELGAFASAEVVRAVATGLSEAAKGLDGFMAELNEEGLGEFPADRWPAGDVAEPADLSESDDEGPAVEPTDAPDAAPAGPVLDAPAEDAPQDPADEDGAQDAPVVTNEFDPPLDHEALVIQARKHKIKGYTKMDDAELVDAIAAAEAD